MLSIGFAASSYDDILKKIQAGDFAGANPGLEAMIKGQWKTGDQEKAVVLYVENCLRLGKLSEARHYAGQFLDFFPKSPYRTRMETSIAILEVLDKDSYAGAETLRRILAYAKNPVAKARARDLFSQIISADLLSVSELESLIEKGIDDARAKGKTQLSLGYKMQKENRYKAAAYWYNSAKKSDSTLTEEVDYIKNTLKDKPAGKPVILVLAPLSGSHAELGSYMVQGITLYADSLKNKTQLRFIDDLANPAVALKKLKQALAQDSVVAVIGPLLSASAATVAAWMSEKAPQIPLITPTATDDGIAEMGKNIFQLNVSQARLAASIAEYAMDCLEINEFAIMAPLGDYGSLMAEEFQRAVERKGGMILAMQNYAEGLPDYQNDFKRLKDRKLDLDVRRINMKRGNGNAKKSWFQDAAMTFPAMFIPSTNPADGGSMATHVIYNFKVEQLLGSSGWHGTAFLRNAQSHAEGSVFSTAFYSSSGDENFKDFAEKFNSKWQRSPDDSKVAGLSYDAVRIINSVLSSSGSLPSAILQKKVFDGVYGKINFTAGGANDNVRLITVEHGKFVEKSPECF